METSRTPELRSRLLEHTSCAYAIELPVSIVWKYLDKKALKLTAPNTALVSRPFVRMILDGSFQSYIILARSYKKEALPFYGKDRSIARLIVIDTRSIVSLTND